MCGQAVVGCDSVGVASSVDFFLEGEVCAVSVSHFWGFYWTVFHLLVHKYERMKEPSRRGIQMEQLFSSVQKCPQMRPFRNIFYFTNIFLNSWAKLQLWLLGGKTPKFCKETLHNIKTKIKECYSGQVLVLDNDPLDGKLTPKISWSI
jgi:hypothetical protein